MASGRGPIQLMSPAMMLNICGNSSIRVLRSHCPSRVIRSSSLRVTAAPISASPSARCRIVRNLTIRNGRPPTPTRICRNSAGPGESSRMAIPTNSRNGARIGSSNKAEIRSMPRFTRRQARLGNSEPNVFSERCSMETRPVNVLSMPRQAPGNAPKLGFRAKSCRFLRLAFKTRCSKRAR